jgi:hypothetical protein
MATWEDYNYDNDDNYSDDYSRDDNDEWEVEEEYKRDDETGTEEWTWKGKRRIDNDNDYEYDVYDYDEDYDYDWGNYTYNSDKSVWSKAEWESWCKTNNKCYKCGGDHFSRDCDMSGPYPQEETTYFVGASSKPSFWPKETARQRRDRFRRRLEQRQQQKQQRPLQPPIDPNLFLPIYETLNFICSALVSIHDVQQHMLHDITAGAKSVNTLVFSQNLLQETVTTISTSVSELLEESKVTSVYEGNGKGKGKGKSANVYKGKGKGKYGRKGKGKGKLYTVPPGPPTTPHPLDDPIFDASYFAPPPPQPAPPPTPLPDLRIGALPANPLYDLSLFSSRCIHCNRIHKPWCPEPTTESTPEPTPDPLSDRTLFWQSVDLSKVESFQDID